MKPTTSMQATESWTDADFGLNPEHPANGETVGHHPAIVISAEDANVGEPLLQGRGFCWRQAVPLSEQRGHHSSPHSPGSCHIDDSPRRDRFSLARRKCLEQAPLLLL